MTTQKDVFLSANVLIQKYGDGAEEYALHMMSEFKNRNDAAATSTWSAIIQAIKVLKAMPTPDAFNAEIH